MHQEQEDRQRGWHVGSVPGAASLRDCALHDRSGVKAGDLPRRVVRRRRIPATPPRLNRPHRKPGIWSGALHPWSEATSFAGRFAPGARRRHEPESGRAVGAVDQALSLRPMIRMRQHAGGISRSPAAWSASGNARAHSDSTSMGGRFRESGPGRARRLVIRPRRGRTRLQCPSAYACEPPFYRGACR